MIHDLKIWTEQFELVNRGLKTFELRKNDRDYQVDDTLLLREWDPVTKTYTGRECKRLITHMLDGLWLNSSYCVLSLVDELYVNRHDALERVYNYLRVQKMATTPEQAEAAQAQIDAAMNELES